MNKEKSKIGFWITIIILIVLLGGSFLINIGLLSFISMRSGDQPPANARAMDEFPQFKETWSYGEKGQTKVVRISLQGPIMRGRKKTLFGNEPDMVDSVLKQIIAATNDPKVKGILLEVNSPGGAVTPSDEIYTMLKRFKATPGRRVVVFIRDLGASGAYYISMASDYIVAEPTAIVGSVGVIMQTMNLKGLGDKLGIQSVTIASGNNKDILNPLKEINPEHVTLLQNLIDEMQDRFASIVMSSRGLKNRNLLDGRVFTATQAKENHFIDQIGYWQDAINALKRSLHVNKIYMIRYERKRGSFLEEIFSAKSPNISNLQLLQTAPTFLYQWNP